MTDQPPPGWVPPGAPPPPPGSPPPPPGPGYGPAYGPPGVAWGAPVHKPGVVALRPLTLGDFFDGAFQTIRRNPKAMVGLALLVSTAFMIVPTLLALGLAAAGELSMAADPTAVSVVSNLGSFFGILATVLLNGMLVHVVAEAVLGRRSTIGETWAATRGRMWRLVGLTLLDLLFFVVAIGVPVGLGLLLGFSAGVEVGLLVGIPLTLAAVVLVVFVQVRYVQLAAPALVLERLGVVASIRRAGQLSHRQFWRLFGIYLLTSLVVGVVSQVIALPLAAVGAAGALLVPGAGGALALVFSTYLSQILVGAITTPFTSAVVALQYVDQRIRKEGLDVQLIAAAQQLPANLR
jgi:hypothetical protein